MNQRRSDKGDTEQLRVVSVLTSVTTAHNQANQNDGELDRGENVERRKGKTKEKGSKKRKWNKEAERAKRMEEKRVGGRGEGGVRNERGEGCWRNSR